jgi:hypothetical protein
MEAVQRLTSSSARNEFSGEHSFAKRPCSLSPRSVIPPLSTWLSTHWRIWSAGLRNVDPPSNDSWKLRLATGAAAASAEAAA